MKTTTLHRTVLAAVIGSALAFGWGKPADARAFAQDGKADNQAQNQEGDAEHEKKARKQRDDREADQARGREHAAEQ